MHVFRPILLLVFFWTTTLLAQPVSGLIQYDATRAHPGYNLFYPANQPNAFLLDNCGRIVHSWPDTLYRPGNSAYLLDDGSLLRTGSRGQAINPVFQAGGAGEVVQRKSWDNEVLWQFTYSSSQVRMHHDIEPMPNGHVLLIAWEYKSDAEAFAAGRDTSLLPAGQLWPDHIVEIQPVGADSGIIVWEWHAWDHLVQDYDPTRANYGVVADHPELIDINYDPSGGLADWLHFNAIDYNESLDQIVVSVPRFDEFWIIDHSTTPEEAASHSGGQYGKGGDLIYRWGNPLAYRAGVDADRRLFFQHDPHWRYTGSDTTHPDYGKIMVFNNRNPGPNGTYSSVDIIATPLSPTGHYPMTGNRFGPSAAEWSYASPAQTDFFSGGLSGAQRLPNGNTLICSGRQGRMFEITPAEAIVWEYVNPLRQGQPVSADSTIPDGLNQVFRLNRYDTNHPAFANQVLTPGHPIELDPDTSLCASQTVSVMPALPDAWRIFPNPASDHIRIESDQVPIQEITCFDLRGRVQHRISGLRAQTYTLEVSAWPRGLYIVRVNGDGYKKLVLD